MTYCWPVLAPAELAQIPAFSSEVPVGTIRNGPIDVAAGVATVDLSGVFDDVRRVGDDVRPPRTADVHIGSVRHCRHCDAESTVLP